MPLKHADRCGASKELVVWKLKKPKHCLKNFLISRSNHLRSSVYSTFIQARASLRGVEPGLEHGACACTHDTTSTVRIACTVHATTHQHHAINHAS